jgi:hypothetical protein
MRPCEEDGMRTYQRLGGEKRRKMWCDAKRGEERSGEDRSDMTAAHSSLVI